MSSRDDVPKPSGSLTAEQRQAMARIEMRRAERLRASLSDAPANESEPVEPLSLLDEAALTSAGDSIEWSMEAPDSSSESTDVDGINRTESSESARSQPKAKEEIKEEFEEEIELSTPGLAASQVAVEQVPAPTLTDLSTEVAVLADAQTPLPMADEASQDQQEIADPEDMLPTVAEVARDASDFQALRASKSPMKRLMDDLSSRMFKNTTGVAVTAVVVSVAAVLLVWSVFFRLDILNEVVALEMVELDLEDKHATLALQLSALNSESMESEIQEQSTRIFPGFPALANWIERVSERAEGMNMIVRYRVEPASYAPVDEVLEVPVIIELEVASEDDGELFSRGMGLIASLLQDHWHLDIASTSAEGDGKGMRTLEMEARVWVFDVEEFVSSSLIADRSNGGDPGSGAMEFGGDAEIIQ